MHDVSDLRATIVPKSDQLNAEQLLAGPMTITVTEVRIGSSDEQPISVHYENDLGRPFKPCKTMRKVLLFAWGHDGRTWPGRSMTLYNDPSVKFGGEKVGGIRISHISDIQGDLQVSLTATKGKKALHTIKRLEVAPQAPGIEDITRAPTVEALKDNFGAAYKATRDTALRAKLKAAYDARLAELTKPAVKGLAEFVEDVDNAPDADAAQAVVDGARDSLTADEFEQLTEAHRIAWTT
jgi:hypothetical protein